MIRRDLVPSRHTYVGLFLVTLTTVMYEIILTRIFSVTMWYHFAFVAISVSMFGMAVGAIVVYLRPRFFNQDRVVYHLWLSAFLFGVSVVLSFIIHLREPFRVGLSISGLLSTAWAYSVIAVPFVFSGICVCLALTKFPRHVSSLYAVDLIGAALACLLVITTLNVTDGPTAVIAVGALAMLAAAFFAGEQPRLRRAAIATALVLGSFAVVHTVLVRLQTPLLPLQWVKGFPESPPLYEKWNSFSRVTVYGDPNVPSKPRGWGLSAVTPDTQNVRQLMLLIDAGAGTVLTGFDGTTEDLERLEYLKYDITNLPHYIRRDAKVLVIGPGGGRDILSALLFKQSSVVGVEINQAIIDTVTRKFGEFTGHLDRDPRVTFVNDEARSYIARQQDRFDILQVSLIDTWAATAAGAFVLTENSLYTVEAWRMFLDRLTANGILAVSRFYFRDRPDEIYRLTTLASVSLRSRGIEEPRRQIVIVRQMGREKGEIAPVGMATVLVSRAPFSQQELDAIEELTRRMRFEIVLSPRYALDDTFATLASGTDLTQFLAGFPVNIAAPTDDSPFFFHLLRLRDVFDRALWGGGVENINMKAVSVLGALLITVVVLTVLCVIVPLVLTTEKATLRGSAPLFLFFSSIGLGFMLIEISQMQRLIIFLGHPTYSLSVVLFAMLASSGLGSYLAGRIRLRGRLGAAIPLALLPGALVLFGMVTPSAIRAYQDGTTPLRVLISTAILFPLGLLMGTAFPLGMRRAATRSPALTPWLWGINGATSVCASVLAVVIALNSGISRSFWAGAGCYAVAFLAYLRAGSGIVGTHAPGAAADQVTK